jgi:hypothetical protein
MRHKRGRYYILPVVRKTLYIFVLLAAVLAWRELSTRPIEHPPGVLVPEQPIQSDAGIAAAFRKGDFLITPRAGFRLRARVLSRENYYLGAEADLSPVDLALGWGVMSDQAVLDRINIRQGGRWYYTRYDYPAPIADRDIIRHSSNMHIVPANDWVEDRLSDVRVGDLLQLQGYLVDIDHPSGFYWRTSLTREDTGGGSCELFYVERMYIEARE